MKNIHLLPTDKASRLCYVICTEKSTLTLFEDEMEKGKRFFPQNIYITSDEEIKERDWCLDSKKNIIVSWGWPHTTTTPHFKKIILTTDQDLIKDGIQSIDDEFLEWFVKNPNCDRVEIKKGSYNLSPMEEMLEKEYVPKGTFDTYKIIIPQEEYNPCKDIVINDKVTIDVTFHNKHIRFENLTSEQAGYLIQVSEFYQLSSTKRSAVVLQEEPKQETLEAKRSYQKHSLTKTKGYKLWCNIIQRCYNPKNHSYKYYGGKGVIMEDYFKNSYENFIDWIKGLANYENWLNSSELSLDRIDNSLGYIRGNIKFSTKTEQVENQNLRVDNKSGYKGVCYHNLNKKYGATITINKSKIFLGYYDTALEAALVYDNYILKTNLKRKTNL
jgi:hypothetical protein